MFLFLTYGKFLQYMAVAGKQNGAMLPTVNRVRLKVVGAAAGASGLQACSQQLTCPPSWTAASVPAQRPANVGDVEWARTHAV
jgi:hypothetical protein